VVAQLEDGGEMIAASVLLVAAVASEMRSDLTALAERERSLAELGFYRG